MIHGYKDVYKPGETLTIVLDSGNYLMDFSTLQLLFRPVYNTGGTSAVKASDLFTLNDLTINQVSLKGHSEHEGRGILTNFMQSLSKVGERDQQEPFATSQNLSYAATGIKEGGAKNFVDKLHLYANVAAAVENAPTFNASVGPYERNM